MNTELVIKRTEKAKSFWEEDHDFPSPPKWFHYVERTDDWRDPSYLIECEDGSVFDVWDL